MKMLLSVLLLLLCSSCVQLGGDTQPLRYYLLQPNEAAQPVALQSDAAVLIEPIRLPAYLDRPQLTTHNNQNQVIIAPLDRWAEPLEENFSRILHENLSRHLQPSRVDSSLNAAGNNNLTLSLIVNSFDGIIDKQISVDIRWKITAEKPVKEVRQGRFTLDTPVGTGYAQLVKGLNEALNDFSFKLAQELAKQN